MVRTAALCLAVLLGCSALAAVGAADCGDWSFKCSNGDCLDVGARCDGHSDCADGSDEAKDACQADAVDLGIMDTAYVTFTYDEDYRGVWFMSCSETSCSRLIMDGFNSEGSLSYTVGLNCNAMGFNCASESTYKPAGSTALVAGDYALFVERWSDHLEVWLQDHVLMLTNISTDESRVQLRVRPDTWKNNMRVSFNVMPHGADAPTTPAAPVTTETPTPDAPVTTEAPTPAAPVTTEAPTPAAPVTTEAPTPAAPVTTEAPTPAAPVTTEAPTPAAPVTTEAPTPAAPVTTEAPTPAEPVTTEAPTTPAAPVTTEAPTTPAAPVTTEAPTPAAPVTTEAPTTPAEPVTTEAPTPAAPVTTEAPTTPDAPTTTAVPWPPMPVPTSCTPEMESLLIPAAGQCGSYVVCYSGRRQLMRCPGVLRFNYQLQTCDWPRNVVCSGAVGRSSLTGADSSTTIAEATTEVGTSTTEEVTVVPTPAWPPVPAPTSCTGDLASLLIPVAGECGKYVSCYSGRSRVVSCPSILLFNYAAQTCDWPRNVDCE